MNPACSIPPISAPAMLPPPMNATFIGFLARAPKIAVPTRTIVEPSAIAELEVVRHSHRQHIDVQPLFAKLPEQRRLFVRKPPFAARRRLRGRGSPSSLAGAGVGDALRPRQLTEFVGCDAGFARFTADVDLQQYVQ